MSTTLKQQIHKSDLANFNLYRRYSNLPTHSDVEFVENLVISMSHGLMKMLGKNGSLARSMRKNGRKN